MDIKSILTLNNDELLYYGFSNIEDFLKEIPEENYIEMAIYYYLTFLKVTDYIVIKIAEQQFLEEFIDNKYIKILENRKIAREEINKLQAKELSLS